MSAVEKIVDFNAVVTAMKKVEVMKDHLTFTVVSDEADAKQMLVHGADAKKLSKDLDAIRKEILKPATEFRARVQEVFNPVLAQLENIENLVKRKIEVWERECRKKQEEANANKQAALDMLGIDLELPQEEVAKVKAGGAQIITRKDWEFEVTDINLVPKDLLRVDEDHVKLLIKQGAREIPGIKIRQVEKKILRSS